MKTIDNYLGSPSYGLSFDTTFEPQSTSENYQLPTDIEKVIHNLAILAQSETAAETDRTKEIYSVKRDEATYEVEVNSSISLEDYKSITPVEDWELLESWAETVAGKTVVFVNPTMEGGGVAMLRPPLVHLMKLLGIDAHWYVMAGRKNPNDENPFLFTKLMHNISQRQAGDQRIKPEGVAVHQAWCAENAEVLKQQPTIQNADIIVIDDPQPAPLKRYIDQVNPNVKWVWRNHIDTDHDLMSDLSTPQGEVANYIMRDCDIANVDAVITHPVEKFAHPGMEDKTYLAPATTEPHDDLNRILSPQEIKAGIDFINSEITIKNSELQAEGRYIDKQALIDTHRPRIVLVARFDESKGMDKAMALGVLTRQKMKRLGYKDKALPQVIIVGNGSVDDPSGVPMYEKMLKLRRENYPEDMEDIVLMRLKHNYSAMNALMYPTANSKEAPIVAMQTSDAEGCETRISDWIEHSVPVVVSSRGGMSLQIKEGLSGIVLDYDKPDLDLNKGADYMLSLLTDRVAYESAVQSTEKAAKEFNSREFTTTANVTRFLRVFSNVLGGKPADKVWQVSQMPRPGL